MPQLDIFAFQPVVSWLIIVFGIFYNIMLVSGLTRIYKILLYRKKKLEYYNDSKESLEKEVFFLVKIVNRYFINFVKIYKFSPQTMSTVVEKSLEIEKEFVTKETILYKNWLEYSSIGIPLYTKKSLLNLIKK